MKKNRFYLLTSLLLVLSTTAFADSLPLKVKTAFRNMYPKVSNVEWEQIGGYYTADFVMDHHEIDVWFDTNGEWVMTTNDVELLEKIPVPVAEAFMKSTWSSMRLKDVRIVTFPKHPTVILIEVEGYNSDEEFQLFYSSDGKLANSINTSELGGEIYPGLFE